VTARRKIDDGKPTMGEPDTLRFIDEYTCVIGATVRHYRIHAIQEFFIVSTRKTR
jgi:hypothetical protein